MQFYRRLLPVAAVSFDLDDTLYNNVPVMQRAEQAVRDYVVREFPQTATWQPHDWAQLRQQIMQRDVRLASDMTQLRLTALAAGLTHFGVPSAEAEAGATAAMAEFMRYRNLVEIDPQVHQLLAQLSAKLPVIAISNGNVNVTEIGLAPYFQLILQPNAELRGKPFTDMFEAAARQFPELHPQQWLHVGDSPYADVLGAHRAGWQSAWFTGGLGQAEHLRVLPTLAYQRLEDLTQHLLK